MIRVAIIGTTGYTASESIRILLNHPQVEITYLTGREDKLVHIGEFFPAFKGRLDLNIELLDFDKLAAKADVALVCLPHKVAMSVVPEILKAGVKVVDFSADYRIHDVALYEEVYKVEHTDKDRLSEAAFGLPELFRETIKGANLVANPGCYPTAASLALAPLLKEKLIEADDIIVNAVSGASGAGRKPGLPYHFPELNENLFAYGVGTHRHMPEIEQILNDFTGQQAQVLFQPHIVSIDRGIAESIYCTPSTNVTSEQVMKLYQDFYADEPFVRVLDQTPTLKNVAYFNFCDIFPTVAKGKVVVFSAIDNLVKGAAGQAVQNMNIISNIPETMGLL